MLSKQLLFVGAVAMTLSLINADALGDELQQMRPSDLRRLYGQEHLAYNQSGSCYRECTGEPFICYFKFKLENFNVMGGACGDCVNGNIDDCFSPNCLTVTGAERNAMTVARQVPGPSIDVCIGDRVVVDLENKLAGANVAIHWHGIHQVATPWSDGVPMVTQCPTHDANRFRYNFIATEIGTHFWHCHSGVHRFNGCFGKLVVRDILGNDPNEELYDIDDAQHEVMLGDWTNLLGEDYLPAKRSSPLHPDSILINGRGTFRDPITNTRTFAPMTTFRVQRNQRTRFRMVNAANQRCTFELCIQYHRMTVIAADGAPVEPVIVDCLYSTSGERYDFVLQPTRNTNITEVYMRVRGLGYCQDYEIQELARIMIVEDLNKVQVSNADYLPVLEYPSYFATYPKNVSLNNPDTVCGTSANLCVPDLIPIPDASYESLRNIQETEFVQPIYIQFDINAVDYYPSRFLQQYSEIARATINNIASSTLPAPPLTQNVSSADFCNADNLPKGCNGTNICECPHVIKLELNKVYDLIFRDGDAGQNVSHPLHVHGYAFQVLEIGMNDDLETGNPVYRYLTRDAPLKDTVAVPRHGYAIVRFRADNPGFWFTHCHVEIHMHLGMQLTFQVGEKSDMVPPPPHFPKCGDYPQWD